MQWSPAMRVLLSSDDSLLFAELGRQAKPERVQLERKAMAQLLEDARTGRADAIILDVHQHVDGRLLLAMLKQHPSSRRVPVFVVAAHIDDRLKAFCRDQRASGLELKPVSATLMARIAARPWSRPA